MKDCPRFKGLAALILILTALLFLVGEPQAASGPDTFRFVVYADSHGNWTQGQEINTDTLNYINNQVIDLNPKPDLVFFLGDMATVAYDKDLHRLIPDWKQLMQGLTDAGIKLYVAIGNHELYDVNGAYLASLQSEFQAFFSDMPGNGPSAYNKLVYSVEFGNSLFVVLDTFGFREDNINWDNGMDELQYWWFYATALQSQAKHKFVLTHGPAFDPEGWPIGNLTVRDKLWQTMKDLHFDLYFCGHDHLYSRWNPDGGNLVQIISGSAGARPDNPSLLKVDKDTAHVYWDYNFTVVDVKGDRVSTQAYAVRPQTGPPFYTERIDFYSNIADLNSAYLLLLEP